MNIENREHLIHAAEGDVVGVFFQGEGVQLEYKESKSVLVYTANLSGPQLKEFAADLENSSVFSKKFKGAPLIRAKTDESAGEL